jgi:hypothetical protein
VGFDLAVVREGARSRESVGVSFTSADDSIRGNVEGAADIPANFHIRICNGRLKFVNNNLLKRALMLDTMIVIFKN